MLSESLNKTFPSFLRKVRSSQITSLYQVTPIKYRLILLIILYDLINDCDWLVISYDLIYDFDWLVIYDLINDCDWYWTWIIIVTIKTVVCVSDVKG